MFLFLIIFIAFFTAYFYYSYQVILLNDLDQIFSQTATKAQEDLRQYSDLLLEDLSKCYINILTVILVATMATFLWILLLKYNAKLIIWLSLGSLPIILSGGLYYSIFNYIKIHNEANGSFGDDAVTNPDGLLVEGDQTLAFDRALQTILTAELMSYVHNENLWLILSIALTLILFILFIILYTLRERVSLSIALIRQASKAINGVKSTLIFPILPRAFGTMALIYGILISLLIISASQPTYHYNGGPNHGKPCNIKIFQADRNRQTTPHKAFQTPVPESQVTPNNFRLPSSSQVQFAGPSNGGAVDHGISRLFPATVVKSDGNNNSATHQAIVNLNGQCIKTQRLSRQHVWKYHALNLFAILWLIHFISGISQTTLAGAFASYYWAYRKPQDIPFFAVTLSMFRVFRYHLGDIAFGSFLIATIRYIRIVIEFIDNRIRRNKSPDINNSTTRSVNCFCRVFFWLLDRFLKYIDRNAYIMMSMYGENYLSSARRAVELLYKNSTRALVLDYVTYFVLLVSRLLITGSAGYVTAQEVMTMNLHFKWLPVALAVTGTYFISKGLFSVYSMAVDTLFMCFLIDSTNNDGSVERPYFMSKDLRRILKRNTVIA